MRCSSVWNLATACEQSDDRWAARRTLLNSLCDIDGATARNALTRSAAAQSPPFIERQVSGLVGDMAEAPFPVGRRLVWTRLLVAFIGLDLVALLLCCGKWAGLSRARIFVLDNGKEIRLLQAPDDQVNELIAY